MLTDSIRILENKYFVIANYPLIYHQQVENEDRKWNSMVVNEWKFALPPWFYSSQYKKMIKFYGSNVFQHKYSMNKTISSPPETIEEQQTEFFQVLHATIHSNLSKINKDGQNINTIPIPIFYKDGNRVYDDYYKNDIHIYDDYMMLVNNYYTPKVYVIKDDTIRTIDITFKANDGRTLPIFEIDRIYEGVETTDNIKINQLLFKIKGELILIA
jgi:hypothetical protein